MQREAAAHVVEADRGMASARLCPAVERAGISDLDMQGVSNQADGDAEVQPALAAAVLDGILDQRLQQKAGDPTQPAAGSMSSVMRRRSPNRACWTLR